MFNFPLHTLSINFIIKAKIKRKHSNLKQMKDNLHQKYKYYKKTSQLQNENVFKQYKLVIIEVWYVLYGKKAEQIIKCRAGYERLLGRSSKLSAAEKKAGNH